MVGTTITAPAIAGESDAILVAGTATAGTHYALKAGVLKNSKNTQSKENTILTQARQTLVKF